MKHFRYKLQISTILLIFTLSAFITAPVLADESTPLPSDTTTTEEIGDAEILEEVVEESTNDDTTPLPMPTVDTEPESVSTPETVSELIESLPTDTSIIVVDEAGEAIPLVTEQAQEAILVKDPIWCPVGVAPKPGVGGCSNSFSNLSSLVAGFVPPAKNGVIWIEAGIDSGAQVEIDGLGTWAPAANYSLTLQGGWVGGTTGNTAIVGTSFFDTAISIVGWKGAVTVNNIAFENANNTLNPGTGTLYVETTKNIVVSNVMAINSTGNGAYLDNRNSTTQASVTVKNTAFNNNTDSGLFILSEGAITITNLTTHFNTINGAKLVNNFDATPSVVSVTKGFFNQNGTDGGLVINSNGAVKLNQITAFSNFDNGVYINNTMALSGQPVTVSGYLHANNNSNMGLQILSTGAVTLTSLITDFNGNTGTDIDNTSSNLPYAVTINGFNSMSGNTGGGGLQIYSLGTITLNNITANSNIGFGANIYNDEGTLPYAVNLKGVNSFSFNTGCGLTISSLGTINVYNVTANNNGFLSNFSGANLYNNSNPLKPQNINLFGVNTFNSNASDGLLIYSYGAITLNNITASYNGEGINDGLGSGSLINNLGSSSPKPIVLKGTNTFNDNDGYGLDITSTGSIIVSNLTANDNNSYGASLYNVNSTFQNPITINGYGVFSNNGTQGLELNSNGTVTITNLFAESNGGTGVYISVIGISKPQSVTLKGNNTFIGNGNATGEHGLFISADGNITVNNLTASQNYTNGAFLDNYTAWFFNQFATFGSITITGFGNFHGNTTGSGLFVHTNGNVNLSTVTANQNPGDGIGIHANGKVTLTCILAVDNAHGVRMYAFTPVLTIKGLSALSNSLGNEYLMYNSLSRSRCL